MKVISQLTHLFWVNVTLAFMPMAIQPAKSPVEVLFSSSSLTSLTSYHVILTSLTGASKVSCPRAVADVAIPTLPADAVVLAGVGQALFGGLSGAWGLHPHSPLGLGQPPDVFALPVHKQVSDAAHVTVVQQSRPHLRKRSPVLSSFTQRTPFFSVWW